MRRAWTIVAAGCLVLAACSDAPPSAPLGAPATADLGKVVTEPSTGPWERIVEGETGPGSLYGLYIPRSWNGDAIFYAHGVRYPHEPVDLRDQDSFYAARDALGALGFAIAYSSFSDNGFALKDGAQRTHQLRGMLASQLPGQPDRSFIVAHSLGSAIGLELVETYPNQYDGALLMCGLVGGSLLQTQYAGHVRALFDVFYPGVIPGDVVGVPPGTSVTLNQIIAAVAGNPGGLFVIASLLQTPLPFVPVGSVFNPNDLAFQTLVGSLYGPLAYQTHLINNVAALAHGTPFDNSGTQYAAGPAPLLPPAQLNPAIALVNATVKRYTMPPNAVNYLERYFTPTGDLQIPVLTLHNVWDPGVPAFHETALLATVTAAGATGNLLQRFEQSYGHCNISAATAVQNFVDMVNWVTTGVKPAA